MIKILVIEDDSNIKQTITDLLETEGYEVIPACNGSEGIELAKKLLPDLIICDIVMPVKNGYDVINEVSKFPGTSLIPFLFLSARVEHTDVRQGMQLGADDYLTKPFKVEELLKAVEVRLKKSSLIKENLKPKDGENAVVSSDVKLTEEEHIFLTVNNKPRFLKIKNIKCITADSEYSFIYTVEGEKLIVRKLLKEWEELLPGSSFLRIHRSTIVNLNFVSKVEKWFNNSLIVRVQNLDDKFVISRRYAAGIRNKLRVER